MRFNVRPEATAILPAPLTLPVKVILPVVVLVVVKPALSVILPPVTAIGPDTLIKLPTVILAVLVADPSVTELSEEFAVAQKVIDDVSKAVVNDVPSGAMVTLPLLMSLYVFGEDPVPSKKISFDIREIFPV